MNYIVWGLKKMQQNVWHGGSGRPGWMMAKFYSTYNERNIIATEGAAVMCITGAGEMAYCSHRSNYL